MITRNVIAQCDNEDPCPAALVIPNTTQEFVFVNSQGWDVVNGTIQPDRIFTYCPKHKETT